MKNLAPLFGAASLLTCILFVSSAANANTNAPWGGSWHLSGGSAEAEARTKAIEAATADLSVFKRGAARSRLGEKLAPPKKLSLRMNGSEVEITRDGKTLKLTADGSARAVDTDDGRATVRAEQNGGKLVVTANGEKGIRTTIYERKGESLTVSVEMTVALLSKPIRLSSTYTAAQ